MIPGSGLIGWQVFQKTIDNQRSAFNASADMARDTAYFREKIGSISSSDELIEDRTLLRVALSAFGFRLSAWEKKSTVPIWSSEF